jgi:ADP-ribosylglycohydrolase
MKLPTTLAAAKCWVRWLRIPTGIKSAGSEAATRSIFTALALNRAGPRTNKWVEQITRVTHTHPIAIDGCQVLAALADTIIQQLGGYDALEACKKLESFSSQTELKKRLAQLPQFLEQKRSPMAVANHFGWDTGVSDYMIPMTVMSCYCFLRYPEDFRRAVESAIRLGGDTRTLGGIVGGLSGTYRGFSELPDHLVRGLADFAYGPTWISKMVMRLSHWPHGVDDLYAPPGEPVAPLELTTTNLLRLAFISWNRIKRIPCALLTNNQPTRLRRS